MENVLFSAMPFTVWWCFPTPHPIMGGFAFTRDTQPSVMKSGFPLTRVPRSVTGIG